MIQSLYTLCFCGISYPVAVLVCICLATAAFSPVILLFPVGRRLPEARWLPVAPVVPRRQLQPRPHPGGCAVRRGARGRCLQVMLTIIRCVGVAESYVLLIAHASSAWAGLWTGESRPLNTRIEWLSKGPDNTEPKQPLVTRALPLFLFLCLFQMLQMLQMFQHNPPSPPMTPFLMCHQNLPPIILSLVVGWGRWRKI